MIKFTALLLLCFSFVSVVQAQETKFFESLYDVPVMPSLYEVKDMAISFDKPRGRIAYAGAQADNSLSQAEIIAFYDKVLPQMGWHKLDDMAKSYEYGRESERLRLFFVQSNGAELLQFMLFPAQNSEK